WGLPLLFSVLSAIMSSWVAIWLLLAVSPPTGLLMTCVPEEGLRTPPPGVPRELMLAGLFLPLLVNAGLAVLFAVLLRRTLADADQLLGAYRVEVPGVSAEQAGGMQAAAAGQGVQPPVPEGATLSRDGIAVADAAPAAPEDADG